MDRQLEINQPISCDIKITFQTSNAFHRPRTNFVSSSHFDNKIYENRQKHVKIKRYYQHHPSFKQIVKESEFCNNSYAQHFSSSSKQLGRCRLASSTNRSMYQKQSQKLIKQLPQKGIQHIWKNKMQQDSRCNLKEIQKLYQNSHFVRTTNSPSFYSRKRLYTGKLGKKNQSKESSLMYQSMLPCQYQQPRNTVNFTQASCKEIYQTQLKKNHKKSFFQQNQKRVSTRTFYNLQQQIKSKCQQLERIVFSFKKPKKKAQKRNNRMKFALKPGNNFRELKYHTKKFSQNIQRDSQLHQIPELLRQTLEPNCHDLLINEIEKTHQNQMLSLNKSDSFNFTTPFQNNSFTSNQHLYKEKSKNLVQQSQAIKFLLNETCQQAQKVLQMSLKQRQSIYSRTTAKTLASTLQLSKILNKIKEHSEEKARTNTLQTNNEDLYLSCGGKRKQSLIKKTSNFKQIGSQQKMEILQEQLGCLFETDEIKDSDQQQQQRIINQYWEQFENKLFNSKGFSH